MRQDSRFFWNYVSNKIWGKQKRNNTKCKAHASHAPFAICNLHTRPVSSWCNTTLAPPPFSIYLI